MLRIKGAKVYDPAHGINGVVQDICIADGKIVADVSEGRTLDASGLVVFPGGVDIHTHVAGAALNFARAMTPENQRQASKFFHTSKRRTGIGAGLPELSLATAVLRSGSAAAHGTRRPASAANGSRQGPGSGQPWTMTPNQNDHAEAHA